jgi:tetratricopeptide (TPR) repeat protein
VAFGLATEPWGPSAARSEENALGDLLETMFDPTRAPPNKTMGLMQRDFIDLVNDRRDELQIAFVVDGTNSMAKSISAVQQLMTRVVGDLGRIHGGSVELGLVVYRDAGAPSGEVSVPLRSFSAEPDLFVREVQGLQPEDGSPYFHELPDLGLHAALTLLPWKNGDSVSRWILLFADAPPYDPDFDEPEHRARRRYDNGLLVDLANRKGVKISAVLCESDTTDFTAFTRCLPATRDFLNEICAGTDGLMLDLSYADVREALTRAARRPRVDMTPIAPVTYADVALGPKRNAIVSLAVLPYITGGSSADDIRPQIEARLDDTGLVVMEGDEFAFATEVRYKLQQIPGIRVKSPGAVERQIAHLRAMPADGDVYFRRLADRLGVDYLLYGVHLTQGDQTSIRSALFVHETGQRLNSVRGTIAASNDVNTTIREVAHRERDAITFAVRSMSTDLDSRKGNSFLQRTVQDLADENMYVGLNTLISNQPRARRDFLQATQLLERALEYSANDAESAEPLAQAHERLVHGLALDESNPVGNALDAYCAFNRAQNSWRLGQVDSARSEVERAKKALNRAYRERSKMPNRWMEVEISADFHLLADLPDVNRAIGLYESLTKQDKGVPEFLQLRAHWMLAGIYAGDWGVPAQLIDAHKARMHVVQIMSGWPESHEASYFRRTLRWDDTEGRTTFAFLPRLHTVLAQR